MFKYLFVVVVGLIALIILFSQCRGIGDRFRERMDEFHERRKERREDRQDWWRDRRDAPPPFEGGGDEEKKERDMFHRFGRFRRGN